MLTIIVIILSIAAVIFISLALFKMYQMTRSGSHSEKNATSIMVYGSFFLLFSIAAFLISCTNKFKIESLVRYIEKHPSAESSKEKPPQDSLLWEKAFEITGITDPAVKDAIRRTY